MIGLTKRQREVVATIDRFWQDRGYGPSIRDLAEIMQIKSINGIFDHLRLIEAKGYLVRDAMVARSLRVTNKWRSEESAVTVP